MIADDAAGNPHTVLLTGVATQPLISLSPSSLTFASQLVGVSSTVKITVTNSGTGAFVLNSATLSGANASEFAANSDACKGTVAPGAACSIQVTFTPLAIGPRLATLNLSDNAPGSPQSVQLTGTAMDFAIDPPSFGTTSATVSAGQTANYQLDIQSLNGLSGTISLNCAWQSAAPAGAACTVSPATLPLAADASSPFQVNVTTTLRTQTASLQITPPRPPSSAANYFSALAAALPSPRSSPFRGGPIASRLPLIPVILAIILLAATRLLKTGQARSVVPATPVGIRNANGAQRSCAENSSEGELQFHLQLKPPSGELTSQASSHRLRLRPQGLPTQCEPAPAVSSHRLRFRRSKQRPPCALTTTVASQTNHSAPRRSSLRLKLRIIRGNADLNLAKCSVAAEILAILLLLLSSVACGGGATGSASTTTGTPAGTYTLILSASTSTSGPAFASPSNSAPAPNSASTTTASRTLSLTLMVQ